MDLSPSNWATGRWYFSLQKDNSFAFSPKKLKGSLRSTGVLRGRIGFGTLCLDLSFWTSLSSPLKQFLPPSICENQLSGQPIISYQNFLTSVCNPDQTSFAFNNFSYLIFWIFQYSQRLISGRFWLSNWQFSLKRKWITGWLFDNCTLIIKPDIQYPDTARLDQL
jgi:hypothetical protein